MVVTLYLILPKNQANLSRQVKILFLGDYSFGQKCVFYA